MDDIQKSLAVKLGHCALFADRDTLEEAMKFAQELIESLPPENKAVGYTALYVLHNTWVKLYVEEDKSEDLYYVHIWSRKYYDTAFLRKEEIDHYLGQFGLKDTKETVMYDDRTETRYEVRKVEPGFKFEGNI